MSTLRKIGMGLVGPGFIAAHQIDAVHRLGDVEVVAIAGLSEAAAERMARSFGVPRHYASIEALLRDPDIDVVTTQHLIQSGVPLALPGDVY